MFDFFKGTKGDKNSKLPLFDNGHVTCNSIADNREEFMGKTVEQIAELLEKNGYETIIRPSIHEDSTAQIIEIKNASKERNIKQVQVSPDGRIKMIDLTTQIIPYEGTGIFKLDSNYNEVKKILAEEKISYHEERKKYNDTDPQWNIISITKSGGKYEAISLFFAKNRLFKICLCEDFEGSLPNGIHTGMTVQEAMKIDEKIFYNDWDEDYELPEGYWLTYHRRTHIIDIITIFIPALERDDFFDYNW